MPLPGFRENGSLPEGHHPVTWEEMVVRFSETAGSKRVQVLANLLRWRDQLIQKGITGRLVLNGSFISAKPDPADFDAILVTDDGVGAILSDRHTSKPKGAVGALVW